MSDSADGVSKALLAHRAQILEDLGFSVSRAEELAPTLESKLRTDVAAEALGLAREHGVYKPMPTPDDPDEGLDAGELAEKYGRRNR